MRGAPAGRTALAVAAVAGLLVAGCAGWSSNPGLTVRVESSLDRPLLIYVNNDWVGTIPARAGVTRVPAAGHGGPPWVVQARNDRGRVLGTLQVTAADQPAGAAVTLGCGTLALVVGEAMAPPPAMADPPLPCD